MTVEQQKDLAAYIAPVMNVVQMVAPMVDLEVMREAQEEFARRAARMDTMTFLTGSAQNRNAAIAKHNMLTLAALHNLFAVVMTARREIGEVNESETVRENWLKQFGLL